jgi:MFS family permease
MVKRGSVRGALASLSLSMLMPSLDTSIANVALPTLADAFAASVQKVQWIVVAYLMAIAALTVVVGRIGDIVGRRRLLIAGIALFTGASLLCGAAPTLDLLIAARVLQGAGAAVMMSLVVALVRDTAPDGRAGRAMGLLGTMSAVGTTLGPSIGGALIAVFGWRVIVLVNVPLGLVNIALAYRTLPVDRRDARPSQPMRFRSLVSRTVRASLAMSALVSAVMMTTLVVGPFYLSRALGLPTAFVGIAMSAAPLVAALSGVPAGRIVDRLGALRVTLIGLVVMSAACLALSVMPTMFGVAGYIGAVVTVSAGYALFQAANNTAVMMETGPEHRGVIAGLLTLSRNCGLVTGASVMGAVFAFASAAANVASASPDAVAAGMRTTFAVATMLIIAALGLAIALTSGIAQLDNRR